MSILDRNIVRNDIHPDPKTVNEVLEQAIEDIDLGIFGAEELAMIVVATGRALQRQLTP